MVRKTKIIATISNKFCEISFLERLYKAGMNIVRLNTAHMTHEDALEVIKNSLEHVGDGSEVIMLLRLNFLGSKTRKPFFDKNPPYKIFVLSQRPKFYHGKTDSIEYAWFVWKKGYTDRFVFMEIL